jgi:hypothetical protein
MVILFGEGEKSIRGGLPPPLSYFPFSNRIKMECKISLFEKGIKGMS